MDDRPFTPGSRVENVDLSGIRIHGLALEGSKVTDAFLVNADISGDIEGLRVNGVDIEPLVQAELDRRFPELVTLRSTDAAGLRDAWRTVVQRWAETTERATALPEGREHQRVDGEWSVVETLRHLVFATDCWLSRAVQQHSHPYHPLGLPWSGVSPQWAEEVGVDLSARPSLAQVLAVRQDRQTAVGQALDRLTDEELGEVRMAPADPGHPEGEHSVLHCFHVLLNEEWWHHQYTLRDLAILEQQQAQG